MTCHGQTARKKWDGPRTSLDAQSGETSLYPKTENLCPQKYLSRSVHSITSHSRQNMQTIQMHSTGEWINKTCIHTVEHDSTVTGKEARIHATTWLDLKSTTAVREATYGKCPGLASL